MSPGVIIAAMASTIAALQATLDEQREAQDVPGVSAVVVTQGEVLFAGASGLADLEQDVPMTPDTALYIGSVSKVLTAVLILQLVESGELSLDEPVNGIGNDSQTPVLLWHLLAHASGLEREGDFGYWFSADFPTTAELAAYLSGAALRFAPGSDTRYSNIGYGALGLVASRALSQTYEQALRSQLLLPLGMTSSGTQWSGAEMANGYTPPGKRLPNEDRPFAGVGESVGDRHVRMYHDARAMSPAFGIYSTANDMGRLLGLLLDRDSDDILSATMRTRMRERHSSNRGLGLRLTSIDGREVARHDGWFAAHRSHLLLDYETGTGIVVLTNGDNAEPADIAEVLLQVTRVRR